MVAAVFQHAPMEHMKILIQLHVLVVLQTVPNARATQFVPNVVLLLTFLVLLVPISLKKDTTKMLHLEPIILATIPVNTVMGL